MKKILLDLGCEPIEPEDFKARISEYIEKYSKSEIEETWLAILIAESGEISFVCIVLGYV